MFQLSQSRSRPHRSPAVISDNICHQLSIKRMIIFDTRRHAISPVLHPPSSGPARLIRPDGASLVFVFIRVSVIVCACLPLRLFVTIGT
jgi:hypothetical protein